MPFYVGALLQAFVTSPLELVIVRGILGIGIGADYVLSPLILAEHSNAKDRGKLIVLGFAMMWGWGFVAASALTFILTSLNVNPDTVWRVVLAAGAIPAAAVIYLRRKIPETPRYLLRIQGNVQEFKEVVTTLAKTNVDLSGDFKDIRTFSDYFQRFGKVFIIAGLLWFLFDIVAYANTLYGPSRIAPALGFSSGALFNLVLEFAFAFPGLAVAIFLIDRIGRKLLQTIGFLGMFASLTTFALFRHSLTPIEAFIIYGFNLFFIQAGPGSVSAAGMLGVELAPTKVRALVQAITVVFGRLGVLVTAFIFPLFPLDVSILILGVTALVSALLTYFGVPETKGRSLEEASGELSVEAEENIKK